MPAKPINEAGNVYGRLTVVGQANRSRWGNVRWECICSCGARSVVVGTYLRSGETTSCGCYQKAGGPRRTHGLSHTPTNVSWRCMLGRCMDPRHVGYGRYGARGITVCERWRGEPTEAEAGFEVANGGKTVRKARERAAA